MTDSKNKLALVTGASRGLGKDIALSLAKKGINLIITYNSNESEAEKVVNEIQVLGQKAVAIQIDLADFSKLDSFLEKVASEMSTTFNVNKFDFLVNNAGIGINTAFINTSELQFDTLLAIQFKAPFFLIQKALNLMNDGGGIVNVSTGLTRFTNIGYSAYAAMKSAMETLTKYLAKELGERNIRANIVAPGAIETDFGGGVVRDNEQVNKFISSLTALGRVGKPDDIGSVVAFLCTEDAKWINGQRIEISGGQQL